MSATGVRRADFREVKPTPSELAAWRKRYPRRAPTWRAEHLVCGTRIWYSGLAIGSHLRACTRTDRRGEPAR